MTTLRAALLLTACLTLSGCFLASEAPRFDDAQSASILGTETTTFAAFDLENGAWTPSETALVSMIPVGTHYLMHDPSGAEATEADPTVHFIPLDAAHLLMQVSFAESEGPVSSYYSVATWDGTELLFSVIACDDLRDRPGITALVSFIDDDCWLAPSAPGAAPDFPPLLWQDLPPAKAKLVLQPAG